MTKKNWRNNLDLLIEENLKEMISSTKEYDYAISKSHDKSKAQMWIAIALLNEKINKLMMKDKKYEKKLSKEELNEIMDTLEKL